MRIEAGQQKTTPRQPALVLRQHQESDSGQDTGEDKGRGTRRRRAGCRGVVFCCPASILTRAALSTSAGCRGVVFYCPASILTAVLTPGAAFILNPLPPPSARRGVVFCCPASLLTPDPRLYPHPPWPSARVPVVVASSSCSPAFILTCILTAVRLLVLPQHECRLSWRRLPRLSSPLSSLPVPSPYWRCLGPRYPHLTVPSVQSRGCRLPVAPPSLNHLTGKPSAAAASRFFGEQRLKAWGV